MGGCIPIPINSLTGRHPLPHTIGVSIPTTWVGVSHNLEESAGEVYHRSDVRRPTHNSLYYTLQLHRPERSMWKTMLPRGLHPPPRPETAPTLSPLRRPRDDGSARLLLEPRERLPVEGPIPKQAGERRARRDGGPYRGAALLGLARVAGMAPQHNKNPSYCGVCGVYVSGLSQHQTRSKTHLALYEPIRQRLAAQRAERRALNFAAGNSPAPV